MTRPATYDERRKWGECPICKAPHGQVCEPVWPHEWTPGATWPAGAHARRLAAAPIDVREVMKLEAA